MTAMISRSKKQMVGLLRTLHFLHISSPHILNIGQLLVAGSVSAFRINSRAGSVLTETEEPAVLEPISGTEKEPEPKLCHFKRTVENRNRVSEPRVTETDVFSVKTRNFNQFHIKS